MKRRIALFMVCIFSLITLLSGCSLFSLNQDKYLNQVVASAGDIEITKEQLLTLYNNYAETLIDSYGYTQAQAVNYCVESLINREIVLGEAEATITLTQKQKNDALIETYDYIIETLADYEGEVRADMDIASSVSDVEEELATTYIEYEPTVEWIDGEIVKVTPATVVDEEELEYFDDVAAGFIVYWVPENEEVGEEAFDRYIADLTDAEEYKKLSTVQNEVLAREINRVYELQIDNTYITAYEEMIEEDLYTQITAQDVVDEYYRLLNSNKALYDLDEIGIDSYVTDILDTSKSGDIIYHPNEGEFFYVSHVLLAFNAEQTAQIEDMQTLLEENAITQDDMDAFVADLAKDIRVEAIDNSGRNTGIDYSANEIYTEITTAVSEGNSINERASIFNEFIYKYNSDPSIQNNEKGYTIGVAIDEETESRSKMVVEFTEAARGLYEAYVNGTGELGDLSTMVLTDYGYHIIFLIAPTENLVVSTNAIQGCTDLNNYLVAPQSSKTYFQKIFDSLVENVDIYTEIQGALINDYKSQYGTVKYVSRYADMM